MRLEERKDDVFHLEHLVRRASGTWDRVYSCENLEKKFGPERKDLEVAGIRVVFKWEIYLYSNR